MKQKANQQKDVYLHVRMSAEMLEAVHDAAAAEERTASDVVRQLLTAWLRKVSR